MTITANNKKITTKVKNTWGETINYILIDKLPRYNEEFNAAGYECAHVKHITDMNNTIAPTTAGDPCNRYNFYRLDVVMLDVLDDTTIHFSEYVAIEK